MSANPAPTNQTPTATATASASTSTPTPNIRRPTGSARDVRHMYRDNKYALKYGLKVGTDTHIHDSFDAKPRGYTTYAGIEKGACAVNALVQAIVHFGGPPFLIALHDAVKAHVAAESNIKFMHALDEIVGQMVAWRGPVRKAFIFSFLDALKTANPPNTDLKWYSFHELWTRFQSLILAAPDDDAPASSSPSSTVAPVAPYIPPFAAVSVDPELAPGSCVDVQALVDEHFAHVHAEQLPAFIAVDLSVSHFADGTPRKYTFANFGYFAVKGIEYCLRAIVRHLGPIIPKVTGKDKDGKDIVERGHFVVLVHSVGKQRFMVLDDENVYEGIPEAMVADYFEELVTYVRADKIVVGSQLQIAEEKVEAEDEGDVSSEGASDSDDDEDEDEMYMSV